MYITGAILTNSYTSADLTQGIGFGLGDRMTDSTGKTYRFYQYNQGAGAIACAVGNAVGFYAPSGVSTGQTTVVSCDVSDTNGILAGVAMAAVANGDYGWFMTYGETTITPALVSGATGNAMTLSTTTDGSLKVAGAVTDAGGAKLVNLGTKTVFVNC